MKLWVDDLRPAPDRTWTMARHSGEAICYLARGGCTEMSLDHDLGNEDTTRWIVLYMCENPATWPAVVRVHTANPVGRRWLLGMIERYQPACSGSSEG